MDANVYRKINYSNKAIYAGNTAVFSGDLLSLRGNLLCETNVGSSLHCLTSQNFGSEITGGCLVFIGNFPTHYFLPHKNKALLLQCLVICR